MKLKYALLVCSLSLAILSGGCGTAPSAQPNTSTAESLAEAMLSYQQILKAAPAVEGEQAALADASFGYDENLKMFGNHYDLFALSDINQDGTPELIALSTVNFRWAPVSVYTYVDGNAVLLKDPLNSEAHGTFEQRSTANGAYLTYICEENHIHSVWRGIGPTGEAAEENCAYALEGAVLTATGCTVGESEKTIYFSDIAKVNSAENADAIVSVGGSL